jgi:hypothetical protein
MTANHTSTVTNNKSSSPHGDKENVPHQHQHQQEQQEDSFTINANSVDNVDDHDDDDDDTATKVSNNNVTTINNVNAIPILARPKEVLLKEISKQVLRHKLQKLRHLVIKEGINPSYLDSLFPTLLQTFRPQHVTYNGGTAQIKDWKISCYLEVMDGGIPCTNPHIELLHHFEPLLNTCNGLFVEWYRQQHSCNNSSKEKALSCQRLMTFITRYTPAPGEQALLKHVDGAGKVDGSCVVALPIDRWSGSYENNTFEGYGGGLTFWDGKEKVAVDVDDKEQRTTRTTTILRPKEIHYDTRSGDIAFIDRAVWHQADPITKGTRWALVIFYKVT